MWPAPENNVVLDDATHGVRILARMTILPRINLNQFCVLRLVNQGKLNGILYLENNLTTGAFTPDRLEVLNLLSSQAAISIENATLYNTLEEKVIETNRSIGRS